MVSSRRAQSYRWTVYECDFRDAQQRHANTLVGGKKGRAKKKGKTHSYAVKVTVLEFRYLPPVLFSNSLQFSKNVRLHRSVFGYNSSEVCDPVHQLRRKNSFGNKVFSLSAIRQVWGERECSNFPAWITDYEIAK